MPALSKETYGGLFFVAAGAFACGYSARYLDMGVAVRMGPGYFPFILGLVLILLGSVTAVGGLLREVPGFGHVPWRPMAMILAAPAAFALTVQELGLLPATALSCLVASLASPDITLRARLVMIASLTALCVLVFHVALQVSVPLLGTWLS